MNGQKWVFHIAGSYFFAFYSSFEDSVRQYFQLIVIFLDFVIQSMVIFSIFYIQVMRNGNLYQIFIKSNTLAE